jgi:hypothetical protein
VVAGYSVRIVTESVEEEEEEEEEEVTVLLET